MRKHHDKLFLLRQNKYSLPHRAFRSRVKLQNDRDKEEFRIISNEWLDLTVSNDKRNRAKSTKKKSKGKERHVGTTSQQKEKEYQADNA